MTDVLIALCPTFIAGIVFFGIRAFGVVAVSALTCVAAEVLFRLAKKEKLKEIFRTFDFTSLVTGVIMGLSLGSQTPLYLPVFGGVFAIIVVKMLFGGTGKNFVNPAVTGRIFIAVSFGQLAVGGWLSPSIGLIGQNSGEFPNLFNLFLGTGIAGCIGETSKLCILVGFAYLLLRGVINWWAPTIFVLLAGLTTSVLKLDTSLFLPSMMSGGLIFAAVFMATDYVTTPNTRLGNIIYFVALGVLTGVFRTINGGGAVSYCILLMNLFVPLIDRYIIPKPFGYERVKKAKKEAQNG